MKSLIAIALLLSACTVSTTSNDECRLVKTFKDVYRKGYSYEPVADGYGEWWDENGHLIGYAANEDENVWNHVECFL